MVEPAFCIWVLKDSPKQEALFEVPSKWGHIQYYPYYNRLQKEVGTLILTSLLEDLVNVDPE